MGHQPKSLSEFTGPYTVNGEEANYTNCPMCGSTGKNTYINLRTGKWFCFAHKHNAGGQLQLTLDVETQGKVLQAMLFPVDPSTLARPEKELPAWRPLSTVAQKYLTRRGIAEDLWANLGLVEMVDEPRIIVPYFGPMGVIVHWTARAFLPCDGPKYRSAPGAAALYVLPDWHKAPSVVLVEGVFDAINVHQHTKLPVIALGGKAISEANLEDLRTLVFHRVTIMLDGDAQVNSIYLHNKLYAYFDCRVIALDFERDPGDMSAEELAGVLFP